MTAWLPRVLRRVHELTAAHHVMFTYKARRELAALQRGLDEQDACDLLMRLTPEDLAGRIRSAVTDEWMYVFKPSLAGAVLYVKLILRSDCIVISFHDDEGAHHDHDEDA